MNGRMAHFLTAPYMSIYYNAGSAAEILRPRRLRLPPSLREDRRRNRSRASSFVYFLLFKVGVKVNAAAEKFPARARLLISRYQIANLETALDYPAAERSPSSRIREPKLTRDSGVIDQPQ